MAWIIAAAAIGSVLLNNASQAQAGGEAQRNSALQSAAGRQGTSNFTPSTSAAQAGPTSGGQTGNPFFDAPFDQANPPAATSGGLGASQPTPQTGGQAPSGASQQGASAAQQGAQIGQILGSVLQQQQGANQAGQASRAQLLASIQPQQAVPFQPTASQFAQPFGQDPRLQQVFGGF